MIKLIKFGPMFGMPDASPFVLKLETYLRLCKIDYEPVNGNVMKAPKAKLPCLVMDGKHIGDSEFCIAALKEKFGDTLNEGLSASEKAKHHFIRLGVENHTYFIALYYRWLTKENAETVEKSFFSPMGFKGKFIFKIVQRGMRKMLKGQGLTRHSPDELAKLSIDDVKAMEVLLGDNDFFGGASPREIDCVMFGFIANMIVPEMDAPFIPVARASKTLVAYHNRMTELVFPEFKDTMLYNG